MSKNVFFALCCTVLAIILAVFAGTFPTLGKLACLLGALVLLIVAVRFLMAALADRSPRR